MDFCPKFLLKKVNLILLTFLTSISANSQTTEIYELIIKELIFSHRQPNIDYSNGTTITILTKPNYYTQPEKISFEYLTKNYRKLEVETFDQFIEHSNEVVDLSDIQIPNLEIVRFEPDSIPNHAEIFFKYSNWVFTINELSK